MKKQISILAPLVAVALLITSCGKTDDSSSEASQKKLLEKANDNAKLIYTTVNNELADLTVMGTISGDESGVYNYKLTDTDSSDPIQAAVWDILEDQKRTALNGSVYIEIEDGYLQFVQWSKDDLSNIKQGKWDTSSESEYIIGQYPDPTQSVKRNVTTYRWGRHNYNNELNLNPNDD